MMHSLLLQVRRLSFLNLSELQLQILCSYKTESFIYVCSDSNNFVQAVLHLAVILVIPRLCAQVWMCQTEGKVAVTVDCLR